MLHYPAESLAYLIDESTKLPWPDGWILKYDHAVLGLLATLVVCFICGAMGSLVVGNRMAFFSDALAHCAFAGVGFGLLLCIIADTPDDLVRQLITFVMVGFGIIIGLLIAFVRDQTGLANDTVIGVFYAGSIGIGAVVMKLAQGWQGTRRLFSIEDFIFGNPTSVRPWEVVLLIALALGAGVFLFWIYNWLVLASANPSLALSRRIPVRTCRYLFIVLLAVMVNLSQQITGTLLINGLLIVPAAAAANLAANLRQMFWFSIAIALLVGLAGNLLSWEISCRFPRHALGISGSVIVLSVVIFVLSVPLGRMLRRVN
jgi:zinc transport system permease protein